MFFAADDGSSYRIVDERRYHGGNNTGRRHPGTASANPRALSAIGFRVLFFADDGVSGKKLWSSDGTAAGSYRIRDIASGNASSTGFFAQHPVSTGTWILFAADDSRAPTNRAGPQNLFGLR